MRRTRQFCSVLLLLAAASAAARGLTAERLEALALISDPVVSPDGSRVVFTRQAVDSDNDRWQSDLWQLQLEGADAEPWQLTTHPANDTGAQFSSDGEWLYFLSERSGLSQVFRLHVRGGDAQAVTRLPVAVRAFRLGPRDRRLVVALATVKPCGVDFACTNDALKAAGAAATRTVDALAAGMRYPELPVARGGLFAFELDASGEASGTPVELTAALSGDVPTDRGDATAFAISPDGDTVVFSAALADADAAWTANSDLYAVPTRGGRLTNLTAANAAADTHPLFLASGDLVWLASSEPGSPADRRRMRRRDGNGEVFEIAAGWDRSPTQLVVTGANTRLYAIARDEGRQRLFEIELDTDIVVPRTAFGSVSAALDTAAGPIVAMDSLHRPVELYRIGALDNALYPLTSVNSNVLRETTFGVYERWQFAGAGGEPVAGFVTRPPGFDPDRRYPLVLLLQDDAYGSYADRFAHRWNPQALAANGYGVVTIDFHGSDGYGVEFANAARGDGHGKTLIDLTTGLAAALAAYPWLDGDRVCVVGAGDGATLVNLLAGTLPERFRCLVSDGGIFELRMAALTRRDQAALEWRFGAPAATAPAVYGRHSPARLAEQWRTPMLIIHDGADPDHSYEQSLAAYSVLQRGGIDAQFLLLSEDAGRPSVVRARYAALSEWLARYLDR